MSNKTILIIEDNPMNQEIASELLNEAGYNVYAVDDADSAVEKTQNIQPDLVLMDLHLPGKDCFEATRELKSIPELSSIPIVAFTALAMDEDQKKALDAGCSGIITKPIDVNSFCQDIEKFLGPISDSKQSHTISPANGVKVSSNNGASAEKQKTRSHFVKMLSHDLKTPVAAEYTILQYLDSSQAGPLNDRQAELIKELLESNRSLERFMRILLNIYYIEEDLATVYEKEADLIHLIQNEISQLTPLAHEKSIVIDDRIQHGPHLARVDDAKFALAVHLLIENTILFSKGHKKVSLSSDRFDDRFVFTLVDPEHVLNENDIAQLSRPIELSQLNFKQNERALAVYLARLLLQLQGGTLHANWEAQESTYTIELPIRA